MKIVNYDREIVNPDLFIPELVLLEIFRYLPLEFVYKFMCVSKVWFYLLTQTLETFYATHYAFYDGHLAVASTDLLSSNFAHDGFSFKYIHSKIRNKLCLAGSSNGLVLFVIKICLNYSCYVYNPLTKKISHVIPDPEEIYDRGTIFLLGFICQPNTSSARSSLSSGSNSCTFMVLRIKQFDNTLENCYHGNPPTEFTIQVFCSDLGEWRVYEISSPPEVTWKICYETTVRDGFSTYGKLSSDDRHRYCCENILITNMRVLYWFEGKRRNRIIAYDLKNNEKKDVKQRQCKLIDLPSGRDEEDYLYQCLGESRELICYSQLQRKSMTLCIWVNDQTSDTPVWDLVHKIELQNMLPCDNDRWFNEEYLCLENSVCPLAFHPVNKHVVLLACSNAYILALNVLTNRFDVLKRPPTEVLDAYPWLRSDLPLVLTPRPTAIPRFPQQRESSKRKTKSRS